MGLSQPRGAVVLPMQPTPCTLEVGDSGVPVPGVRWGCWGGIPLLGGLWGAGSRGGGPFPKCGLLSVMETSVGAGRGLWFLSEWINAAGGVLAPAAGP